MEDGNLGFDVNPNGTRLVIVQSVFLVLAWTVMVLRGYVKLFMTRKILVDDWLMLAALFVYTGYAAIAINGVVTGGNGKHTLDLTLEGVAISLRGWYLCEVLYSPLSALIRSSIALFLLRLVVKPWHVWVIRINLVVIWVISAIYFFIMVFQCSPASYFWEGPAMVSGATGTCIQKEIVPVATITHSAVSAVSDWVLGLLPIAMLWNVGINRRTKAGIACLLSMGLVAGVALIVRIPLVKNIAISVDFLYETVTLAIWAVLEPSLGIIAGSIAAIRPLFKGFGFSGLSRSKRSNDAPQRSPQCYGKAHEWYPSLRLRNQGSNHLNLDNLPMSNGSQLELRGVDTKSQASAWDIEGGGHFDDKEEEHRGGGGRARDAWISVHTSINVSSNRTTDVDGERSSGESGLTRDLAGHGGSGLSAPKPPRIAHLGPR